MRFAFLLVLALAAQAADIRIDRYQAVKMRDGVTLYADVYRPAAAGKYPTLIVRTPYGVQREQARIHDDVVKFAQHGYAVVVQDVRGRYESGGAWVPFVNEAKDGYDTIEWAAAQPWSNGRVGTQGGSYLGHVQWAAGSQSPPHLKAMFPAVASTNIYANWISQGGAFRLSFNYGWGVVRMPNRIMLPQWWHTGPLAPSELRYEKILRHVPLQTGDLESAHYAVKHYRDWLLHDSYDAYWKAFSDEERFDKIQVPVHTQGGWFDIFLAGTINGFVGARAKGGPEARKHSRMLIGPWGHGPSRQFGDIDFGPAADRKLFDYELRFFDHYLKGEDKGLAQEEPVQIFYMGANKWKGHASWPIPGAVETSFYLNANGQLSTQKGEGVTNYTYDPNNPVPTTGGNNCCGSPTVAGPVDQAPLDARADIVRFVTAPLTEPLAIAGPVKMMLSAATDGPDTDWMVKLIDVHPDGKAFPMAEGMLRARFRQGLSKPARLTPGTTYEYTIDMVGTAVVFQPGHKIRVDITSSNFPQFDRNLNTGEALGVASQPRVARQTIHHNGSRIVLPVVPLP